MKKTRVGISSVCDSIYDIVKLRRKYSKASKKISETEIVFNIM
jgi:hypothetical protein